MSIVYTPTEGDAIQNYSRLFRRPEGCYLNIHDQDQVHSNLAQWGKAEDIDYIVVSGKPNITHRNSQPTLTFHKMEKRSLESVTRALEVFSSQLRNSFSQLCAPVSIPTGLCLSFLTAERTMRSCWMMISISASRRSVFGARSTMNSLTDSSSRRESYIPTPTSTLRISA